MCTELGGGGLLFLKPGFKDSLETLLSKVLQCSGIFSWVLKKGCHSSFVVLLSLLRKLVSVVFSVLLLALVSRSFPISHSSVEYLSFET